jgi:hypothetical protein
VLVQSEVVVSSLGISLSTIGISQAKGVELVMQRDQLDGTLPRGKSAAQQDAGLTPADQRRVDQLKQIDRNVREHEAAHLRAGQGVVTSGASFTYTYGPDGKAYAVGGEVGVDTSKEAKPEQNIDKGARIQAAALAPRDPSPQDYRVASIGGRLEAEGRTDLSTQQRDERAARLREQAQQSEAEASPGQDQTAAPAAAEPEANGSRERIAQAYDLGGTVGQSLGFSAYA